METKTSPENLFDLLKELDISKDEFWEEVDLRLEEEEFIVDVEDGAELVNDVCQAVIGDLLTEAFEEIFKPMKAIVDIHIIFEDFHVFTMDDGYIKVLSNLLRSTGVIE